MAVDSDRYQDPRGFEREVADVFRNRGWTVSQRPPGTDAGIDLEMENGETTAGVQVKYYEVEKVSRPEVQQYAGAKLEHGYDEFYLVTSGEFTEPAKTAGEKVDIELINGAELESLADSSQSLPIPTIKRHISEFAKQVWRQYMEDMAWVNDNDKLKIAAAFCVLLIIGGLTGDTTNQATRMGLGALLVLLLTRAVVSET